MRAIASLSRNPPCCQAETFSEGRMEGSPRNHVSNMLDALVRLLPFNDDPAKRPFTMWTMLGSNQRPPPCEGDSVCPGASTRVQKPHKQAVFANAVLMWTDPDGSALVYKWCTLPLPAPGKRAGNVRNLPAKRCVLGSSPYARGLSGWHVSRRPERVAQYHPGEIHEQPPHAVVLTQQACYHEEAREPADDEQPGSQPRRHLRPERADAKQRPTNRHQ